MVAAAIVAATVSSFLNLVLPKLCKAVGEDLQEDVRSISMEMRCIDARFKDFSKFRVQTTESMKLWLQNMELLAYDIEDITDCFLSNFMPRDQESEAAGFFSLVSSFAMRKMTPLSKRIGGKIRQLKKRLEDQRKEFELIDKIVAPAAPMEVEDGGANAHVSKEDQLLRLLIHTPEKKLKVISIVGYGALGNTLLVDRVYSNKQVQKRFHWSTRYNAAGKEVGLIIQEIGAQVTLNQNGGSTSNMGEAVRQQHQDSQSTHTKDPKGKAVVEQHHEAESTTLSLVSSRSSQKDERYLIVIDNVGMDNLRAITNNFDGLVEGITIIMTTDYREAMHCKCTPLDLDKGDDQKYMWINEVSTETISEGGTALEEETRKHKQKLQHLLVRNYKESLSTPDFEPCLLYFCMFPRHHLVRWNLLVRRYRAEGIDIDQRDQESRSYLDFLKIFINQHALHVSKNGQVKRCQFPVMMLNHILGESTNSKNFLTSVCGSTPTPTCGFPVRRLSFHPISAQNEKPSLPDAKTLPRLRTLAVFHTGSIDKIEELSKYELMRVLDLKACTELTNGHLEKICDLLLLKYLSLGDRINEVPRGIAKLQWLETLAMTKTQEVYVPVEVIELPRIKHLVGKFKLYEKDITQKKMKKLLSKPSQLERLSGFVIGDSKQFQQLMNHMKKLEKVKIWCATAKWTHDVTTAIKDFIGNDPSKKLSLSIECEKYPQEIVKCLQHHGSLTSLKLSGDLNCKHCLEVQLKGIKVLCLSRTNLRGVEIVSVLKFFLALDYLKLVEDNLGPLEIPADCLYSLEQLCLVAVDTLHGIKIEARALPCLVSLHMLFETQGDLSGIDIKQLSKLKELALYSDVADKKCWEEKAGIHQNNPKVLLIQRPNSGDEHSPA